MPQVANKVDPSFEAESKIETTASVRAKAVAGNSKTSGDTQFVGRAEGNSVAVSAHSSWRRVTQIQYVGDPEHAQDVARAAAREFRREYGEALERLAD